MHIQDTCVNLLLIFGKDDFGMFLRCWGKISLSTCPFFIFRFCPHDPPWSLYIYLWVLVRFYLISFKYAKIQIYNFVVQPSTCHKCLFQKLVQKFAGICMQFGNNWYLAIIGPRSVQMSYITNVVICLFFVFGRGGHFTMLKSY